MTDTERLAALRVAIHERVGDDYELFSLLADLEAEFVQGVRVGDDGRLAALRPARRGGLRVLHFDNDRSERYESIFVQVEPGREWDRILIARDDGTIADALVDAINAQGVRVGDDGLAEKTALGYVWRRDLYDILVGWLDADAREFGTTIHMTAPDMEVPALAATVAAALVEKWLTEVYQPALGDPPPPADDAGGLRAAARTVADHLDSYCGECEGSRVIDDGRVPYAMNCLDSIHVETDRLRAALAAQSAPPALDRERLARALEDWWASDGPMPGGRKWNSWLPEAAAIADAYEADDD